MIVYIALEFKLGGVNYRYFLASPVAVNDGNWHCTAFTCPGAAQTDINSSQMFADSQVQSIFATDSSGAQASKTGVYLGRFGANYGVGVYGEVFLFNRVFSFSEYLRIYLATRWRYQ